MFLEGAVQQIYYLFWKATAGEINPFESYFSRQECFGKPLMNCVHNIQLVY